MFFSCEHVVRYMGTIQRCNYIASMGIYNQPTERLNRFKRSVAAYGAMCEVIVLLYPCSAR